MRDNFEYVDLVTDYDVGMCGLGGGRGRLQEHGVLHIGIIM